MRADERDDAVDDSHELRARDMEVRTEHALRQPDGTLDLLPSYQYALGPDGLPYAVDPYRVPEVTEASPPIEAPDAEAEEAEPPPERPPKPGERPSIEQADEHVVRSYARFDDTVEGPPKLDTIA